MKLRFRPDAIRTFERLFLGATALSVITVVSHYQMLRNYMVAQGGTAAGAAATLVFTLIYLIINVILWLLISRRASNAAKWAVVILTLFAVIAGAGDALTGGYRGLGWTYIVLEFIGTFLHVAAIWYLFRPDAIRWLNSKGRHGEVDPEVFV